MFEQTNRPILKLRFSAFEKIVEFTSFALVSTVFIYLIVNWGSLPERIPAHYNVVGEVNRWSNKTSFLTLPVIMGLFYIGFTILNRFPHVFNYLHNITPRNAELQYRNARLMLSVLKLESIGYMTYIMYRSLIIGINKAGSFGVMPLLIFISIIFITLVYFLIATNKIEKKLKC